ncbi:MAG: DUF4296 domain-containing protein [Candidatus Cryptobacteroides sp.]
MKRIIGYFFIALIFLSIMASCARKARVIPKSKLEKIYMEMLLVDQWIGIEWSNTRVADTSVVYEQIFEKYGYTSNDYRKSVSYYMEDPDRFAKIFENISNALTTKANIIDKEQKDREKADSIRNVIISRNFRRAEIFFYKDVLSYKDSILFYFDSIGIVRSKPVESDSLFMGPELVIKERRDSILLEDSAAFKKKTEKRMSLKKDISNEEICL